jgi:hypothetical protein
VTADTRDRDEYTRIAAYEHAREAGGNALYLDPDDEIAYWPHDDRGRVPADWRPLYVRKEKP